MLRAIGFALLLALAIIGLYTVYNANTEEIERGKDKIERALKAFKNELER